MDTAPTAYCQAIDAIQCVGKNAWSRSHNIHDLRRTASWQTAFGHYFRAMMNGSRAEGSGFAVAADGARIHFEIHDYTDPWKNAPYLILQHGFGRSGRYWRNFIPYLSRFYRVVCPDLRGLGQSSRQIDPATAFTLENYLGDLLVIADTVGAETFHYAGESFGGMLGLALAARHGSRLRTLSVLAASLRVTTDYSFGYPTWQDALHALGPKGWAAKANAATRFPADADPGLLEWFADEFGRNDVDVMVAMSRAARALDMTPFLDAIQVPTLGMYPSGGPTARPEQLATMQAKIPDLRLVRVRANYHMFWVVMPATCANTILHFAASHDGIVCIEA